MSDEDDAPVLADEYVAKQKAIELLDKRCAEIKVELRNLLPWVPLPGRDARRTEAESRVWVFPNSKVEWVKGRHSEKVDTGKLRVTLVLLGVPEETIKKAFEQATAVSDGEPTMRVTGLK